MERIPNPDRKLCSWDEQPAEYYVTDGTAGFYACVDRLCVGRSVQEAMTNAASVTVSEVWNPEYVTTAPTRRINEDWGQDDSGNWILRSWDYE